MTEAVRQAFLMEKKYQEEIELTSLDTIDGYEHFIFITHEGHVQRQDNLNAAISESSGTVMRILSENKALIMTLFFCRTSAATT